jgi:hypothetical protein
MPTGVFRPEDGRMIAAKRWQWTNPKLKDFFQSFYQWDNTASRQNYIGAEAAAFTEQMLPIDMTKGPGEVVLRQLIATAPQVQVLQQVVPTGIAGIGSGQIWNGGLIDNGQGKIV